MTDHDDDVPELSNNTLAALQEFYSEREVSEQRFADLKAGLDLESAPTALSMDMFTEDWNTSQFWYSDETAILLAKELLETTTKDSYVAIVSAPSVFIQIKNIIAARECEEIPHITLLEIDKRFNVFKEFVHYDFQSPFQLPIGMKGRFDRIICDPPFLSVDCQTKAAMTVRWLSNAFPQEKVVRTIVCTGERMEELILKLYPNIHTTTFEPKHAQDRLSNDFRCYANYQCDAWTWR